MVSKDIAIIGMAGRFPDARNTEELYANLKNGIDSVRPLSEHRKISTTIPLGYNYQILASIENIDLFDSAFFKISPGEAQCIDPRQRLMLEVVYETFENAGYNIEHFNGTETSIFVADTELDYYKHAQEFDPTLHTGNLNSATAGRIARFFNLRGLAEMVDTACSSSLVAIYHACNELILGNSPYALACGVNLILFPPLKGTKEDGIGIMSVDGKAKSFSADANGTANGEAVGCVLLKTLDQALMDRDKIHAVIKSVVVNQDGGLSASLTAPDSIAQADVIKKAWRKAQIDPATIGFIEAHGTGTKLGDPIEIDGLDMAFEEFTDKKRFCAISSIKTNIGHTDGAAGIMGLIKAVLSLKEKVLFPSLHFIKPNPFIDFENSAVYVNTECRVWGSGDKPKRAGVSSFGLIGTNCHVVLEEALKADEDNKVEDGKEYLFTFTASSLNSLKLNVNSFCDYLKSSQDSLNDISYVLNAGRKHYAFRHAVVASSKEALQKQLSIVNDFHKNDELNFPDKIFFSFSDNIGISFSQLDQFSEQFELFDQHRKECEGLVQNVKNNSVFYDFTFQYSFYKLLESIGVRNNLLMGDGIGKVVISVLQGELSLREGIKRTESYKVTHSELNDRLLGLIDNERNQKGSLLFVEIGKEGNITKALNELKHERKQFEVVTLCDNSSSMALQFFKDLFLSGFEINWDLFYQRQNCKRIELPTYEFDRKRSWIKDFLKESVSDWLYQMEWIASGEVEKSERIINETILLISDGNELSDELNKRLVADNNHCINITIAEYFEKDVQGRYIIDGTHQAGYVLLKNELEASGIFPTCIIDLLGYHEPLELNIETLEENLAHSLYPQCYISKIFSNLFSQKGFKLFYVSNRANNIGTHEHSISPLATMSVGLSKAVLSEYPSLNIKSIDFDSSEEISGTVDDLMYEFGLEEGLRFVSYRKRVKYIPQLISIPLNEDPVLPYAIENGVYIITGGAGDLGLEICKSLTEFCKCTILVLGRSELPPKSEWNYVIENKKNQYFDIISTFKLIETKGSTIEYFAVNIGDSKEMSLAFEGIKTKYNKVTGVLHLAGIGIKGMSIEDADIAVLKNTLNPKVNGTLLLHKYVHELEPDFFVLFSSLNSLVPQKYSFDYAVANIFEDAFPIFAKKQYQKVITINWPGWSKATSHEMEEPANNLIGTLDTKDGLEAFYKILNLGLNNVVVANMDLSGFLINPFFEIIQDKGVSSLTSSKTKLKENTLSKTENVIMSVWCEILKYDSIELTADFFEIGGHSLNGTQVISKLEKEFGIELDFEIIFEYGTIKELSGYIDDILRSDEAVLYEEIKTVEKKDLYDLSYAQMSLWKFDQLDDVKTAYIMPDSYKLTGTIDIEAFIKSFDTLVERHESLRTTFELQGEVPKQKIHSKNDYSFLCEYLDIRTEEGRYDQALALAKEDAVAPFDLATGPLIRVKLLHLEDNEYVILLALHHIVTDQWSLNLLFSEVITMYMEFKNNGKNPLKPLRIQYKDYVVWLQGQLSGEKSHVHKDFWLNKLKGQIPKLNLPYDYEKPERTTYKGDNSRVVLEEGLSKKLRSIGLENGTTTFVVLLTIYKVLLFRYTGQNDIVIGSPVAGRKHPDLEHQIGFYVNVILLRTQFDPTIKLINLIQQIRDETAKVYKHDIYPLGQVTQDLNALDLQDNPTLYNSGFSWNKDNAVEDVQIDFDIERLESYSKTSVYDLWLYGVENKEQIALTFEFNVEIFRKETIDLMLQRFVMIAECLSENGELLIDEIDFSRKEGDSVTGSESLDREFDFDVG